MLNYSELPQTSLELFSRMCLQLEEWSHDAIGVEWASAVVMIYCRKFVWLASE